MRRPARIGSTRRVEPELGSILDSAPDAIVLLDRNLRCIYANRAVERIFYLPAQALTGRSLDEIGFRHADSARWAREVGRVYETGEAVTIDLELRGTTLPRSVEVRFVPEHGPGGGVSAVVAFLRDVTERRREERREVALLAAESARRVRDAERRYDLLSAVTEVLDGAGDQSVSLSRLVHLLVPAFADGCVIAKFEPTGRLRPIAAYAQQLDERSLVDLLEGGSREAPRGRAMQERVIRSRRALILDWSGPRVRSTPLCEPAKGAQAKRAAGGARVADDGSEEVLAPAAAREVEHALRRAGCRSAIVAPLLADGRALGLVGFFASISTGRPFGASDIDLAQDVARRVALVLERSRAHEAERRARDDARAAQGRLAFIAEATTTLSSSLDYETTLETLSRLVVPVLAAYSEVRGLGGPGADHVFRWGSPHRAIGASEHGLLEEARAAALATKQAQIVAVASLSAIVTPLITRDGPIASLTLVGAAGRGAYAASDLVLCEELARRAAIAIENSRLFREAQEAEATSRRQAARVQALSEASRVFAALGLDLQATIAGVARHIGDLFGAGCALRLVDQDGGGLIALHHTSEELGRNLQQILDLRGPTLDEAPAALIAPLPAQNAVIGHLIVVRDATGAPFEAGDRLFLEDLADRAAMAIEAARRYEQAQEAIRIRDDFLSIASHELKTPLTGVQLHIETARRRVRNALAIEDDASHPVGVKLQAATKQILRLGRLIDELLDVTRITAGRLDLELEPVDLAGLARDLLARLEDDAVRERPRIALRVEEGCVGLWDRVRLEQVITQLLSNALKYGEGKPIELSVRREGQHVKLEVKDSGMGIASEDQARIFARFERLAAVRHFGGFGLGLWIARQIIEALGGRISVESAPGKGSTFTVELDLEPSNAEVVDVRI